MQRRWLKALSYGFAKYMRDALPNASFIGFSGTPIEADDVNTPAVFGHDIDVYDISRAVEDGATVPIYYASRLARIDPWPRPWPAALSVCCRSFGLKRRLPAGRRKAEKRLQGLRTVSQ